MGKTTEIWCQLHYLHKKRWSHSSGNKFHKRNNMNYVRKSQGSSTYENVIVLSWNAVICGINLVSCKQHKRAKTWKLSHIHPPYFPCEKRQGKYRLFFFGEVRGRNEFEWNQKSSFISFKNGKRKNPRAHMADGGDEVNQKRFYLIFAFLSIVRKAPFVARKYHAKFLRMILYVMSAVRTSFFSFSILRHTRIMMTKHTSNCLLKHFPLTFI